MSKLFCFAMIWLAMALACPPVCNSEEVERQQCPAMLNEGINLIRRGELRQAERTLEEAGHGCATVPGYYATFLELTRAFFEIRDNSAARRTAAQLSALAGSNAKIHFSLGLLLAQNGQYQMAAGEFVAVPLSERDFATYMDLGMVYSKLGRFREARNAYQSALELNSSSPEPYLHLGLDAAALGKNAQAINWLGQAHADAPGSEDITYAYAEALIQAGNYERASNVLSDALQHRPRSAELIEAQGDLYLQQNQDSEAKQAYLKCLAINPNVLRARISLATAYLRMREPEAARQQLKEVLRIQPDNPEANAQLGRMAFEGGQQEEARRLIELALKADPDNDIANATLAQIDIREDNYSGACTILQKLVKLHPGSPRFHYLLGTVLMRLGRAADAQREFRLSKSLQNVPGAVGSTASNVSR